MNKFDTFFFSNLLIPGFIHEFVKLTATSSIGIRAKSRTTARRIE